jgi:CheY-specific phosphatase CheX
MAVKFFGQYLLEKNIIKREELLEAVEFQKSKNMDFGECAFAKGYITDKDLANLKSAQKQVDMKFGEVAIKLNILTPEQVEDVLDMQKKNHIFLGEALIEKGILTSDVAERELSLFNQDQSKYITGDIKTPDGIKNTDAVKSMVDMTQKMYQRIARLQVKVDDGFVTGSEPSKSFLLASISLHGSLKYEYALSLSREISALIASAIIGEDIDNSATEIIKDGVKEFCNIICGNIISKLSISGIEMDISPPQEAVSSGDSYNFLRGRKAIYYPLVSFKGDSTLILIEG